MYFNSFRTSPFCNYSYALVGEKATKHYPKLRKNLTVCASISSSKVEMLRFYQDGTKKEMFEEYFTELTLYLSKSYQDKKLVIIMDNLWSHKCSFILKIMSHYPNITILYTPANTPM